MVVLNETLASQLPSNFEGLYAAGAGIAKTETVRIFNSYTIIATLVLSTILWQFSADHGNSAFKAPIVGPKWTSISRFDFMFNGQKRISEGYQKYKDKIFKLVGQEMVILPARYVDELRAAPENVVSSIIANNENFQGVYSATALLNDGPLHTFVLNSKLTPQLANLVPINSKELAFAFEKHFPKCENDWESRSAFELLMSLISRTASRLFVGEELCRNQTWISGSRGYTDNALKMIVFLRLVPFWIKPIIAAFIPFTWLSMYHYWRAKSVLKPLIRKRRQEHAEGTREKDAKFSNLLQFMDDAAIGSDKSVDKLAGRTLILALASSHTSTMATTQALFCMCEHPEFVPELREEMRQVIKEDGGLRKQSLTKLKKLDSFLKESQRVHPPSLRKFLESSPPRHSQKLPPLLPFIILYLVYNVLLSPIFHPHFPSINLFYQILLLTLGLQKLLVGFKRAFLQDFTFADGTVMPKGAHTLMAIQDIQSEDPRIVEPEKFDGLRYWRMRQEPGMASKMQFATTDNYTLHFGHGRSSCPGRFLASNVIKMVLGEILLKYDFRFEPGTKRPDDLTLHEYNFPNPWAKVQFKRLPQEDGPQSIF